MTVQLLPATLQTTLTAFSGVTISDAWIQVSETVSFSQRRPTALIVGSVLEFSGAGRRLAARTELQDICKLLAGSLSRYGYHLVNGACPGLPDDVMLAFRALPRTGISVGLSAYPSPADHRAEKVFAPDGFPISADVTVFCGSGFELLNVFNTLCADLLVVIGGGVGTLLEVATAVEQELPVICLATSGGIAEDVELTLHRFIAAFKTFNIATVHSVGEIDAYLGQFSRIFATEQRTSRLTSLVLEVSQHVNSAGLGVTITISDDMDLVRYATEGATIDIYAPNVLIDRARLARIPSRGETILNALDEHPRTFVVGGVSAVMSPQRLRKVWGPSIDTLMLFRAVRSGSPQTFARALEVGTGCGLLALWLVGTGQARHAVGIDTSREAVLTALWNAERQGLHEMTTFAVKSFREMEERGFDLILCNPPYLAVPSKDVNEAMPYAGTSLLIDVLDRYADLLTDGGVLYLIVSSASYLDPNVADRLRAIREGGCGEVVAAKEVPMKVAAVSQNQAWLEFLLGDGGITERDADDYKYWHRIETWRLTASARNVGDQKLRLRAGTPLRPF